MGNKWSAEGLVTWGNVRLLSYCSVQSDHCSEGSALSRAGDPIVSGADICRLLTVALSKGLWGRGTFWKLGIMPWTFTLLQEWVWGSWHVRPLWASPSASKVWECGQSRRWTSNNINEHVFPRHSTHLGPRSVCVKGWQLTECLRASFHGLARHVLLCCVGELWTWGV